MPGDSELRAWMHGEGSELPAASSRHARLDAAAIIRRTKRRRLPRQIGAGGVMTLAVAGISVASITGLKALGPNIFGASTSAERSAGDSGAKAPPEVSAPQDSPAVRDGVSPDRVNRCGSILAAVPQNRFGLVLAAHFPADAPATGAPVTGSVTLTNTSARTISGTSTSRPTVTISRDGVVVWHSNGVQPAGTAVTLAPGQSLQYPATFTPVACTASDDRDAAFPAGLPALAPGQYAISVLLAIDVSGPTALVGTEPVVITLR
jgi:hypothetical protein